DTGALGWARLRLFEEPEVTACCQVGGDPPFLAAALLSSPWLAAGVRPDGVHYFTVGDDRLRPLSPGAADLRGAVACSPCRPSRELVVVCRGGDVVRVPMPE